MFDFLTRLITDSAASYFIIAAVVCVDSFFPLVPGETAAITGGLLAANGDLVLPLVLLAAWAGGIAGDNITYGIGRGLGTRARRRFFRSDKALHRLAWAEIQLERRGGPIIVAARFIPGRMHGDDVRLGQPRNALGHLPEGRRGRRRGVGGLRGRPRLRWRLDLPALDLQPLAVALGIALVVTAAGEVYRRVRLPDESRAVKRREREFARDRRRAESGT